MYVFWILLFINTFFYLPLFISSNSTCSLFSICEYLLHNEKLFIFSFVYIFLLPVFFTKSMWWTKTSIFFIVVLLLNLLLREDTLNDYFKIGPIPTSIYIYILFIVTMTVSYFKVRKNK